MKRNVISYPFSLTSNTDQTVDALAALSSSFNSLFEPRSEKTGLRGYRPGPTQTELRNY